MGLAIVLNYHGLGFRVHVLNNRVLRISVLVIVVQVSEKFMVIGYLDMIEKRMQLLFDISAVGEIMHHPIYLAPRFLQSVFQGSWVLQDMRRALSFRVPAAHGDSFSPCTQLLGALDLGLNPKT